MEPINGYPNTILSENDTDKSLEALKKFNAKNSGAFIFGKNDMQERKLFVSHLLDILKSSLDGESTSESEYVVESLSALVVMSRDHMSMNGRFLNRETWKILTVIAGLLDKNGKAMTVIETSKILFTLASKCLCNIMFISKDSQGYCCDDELIKGILQRLKSLDPKDESNDTEVEFLTLRLLFLVSVLNVQARTKIIENHEGSRVLLDYLNSKLTSSKRVVKPTPCIRASISPAHAKSCCEILRTLFNLNLKYRHEESQVKEERITIEFEDLTSVCRKLYLVQAGDDKVLTEKLHGDAGNCLYTVPRSCLLDDTIIPLIDKYDPDDVFSYNGEDIPQWEERDLSAVLNILKEVELKIHNKSLTTESLQPVLSLLSHISRTSRYVRKYCKNYVIPPRKDFEHRPEVGPEFRNKLIKLFTHANTEVKAAAADFVFVLCREKVERLVKYTGYGNAAGLLASRGLLAGGQGDTVYSDCDSDSDTEEYLENAEKINPITGHIPPNIPNPMEGMSEEQKEYLAVQLANQISKLSSDDIIKPVCIDPDTGNLVPFQQKVHNMQLPEEKDSDEDID
ncbi:chaperone Ric-8A-like [Styela clava]